MIIRQREVDVEHKEAVLVRGVFGTYNASLEDV